MKDLLFTLCLIICVALAGLGAGISAGKKFVQNQAVSLGYGELYVTNNTQSFRWLCDSPAVEGVGVVEGCMCFSEDVE